MDISLNRKKDNLSLDQKRPLLLPALIVGILLTVALTVVVVNATHSRHTVPDSDYDITAETETIYNQGTFKEAFLANCTISAKATLSEATAAKYCSCVLDGGIEKYGTDRFIEINRKVAQNYDLSEFKDLIDACATQVTTLEN